jgi:hypothetical protein
MIKNILVAAAFGAVAFGAQAAPIVGNGSLTGTTGNYVYNGVADSIFAAMPTFGYTSGTVSDWSGSFVSIASNSDAWGTPASLAGAHGALGSYVAGIQADGTLSQSISLEAGTYQLSWLDANRSGGSNQSYNVSFDNSALQVQAFDTTVGGGWTKESIVFTVDADTTGLLTFKGLNAWGTGDATSFIDNVSITAVPEPTSLMLMAVGTLGLLAWRRRAQV